MNGWRWQIWVPRALFVGVALLAAQYVLGLAVRSAAVDSSVAAIGTRVEIGSSRVSLMDHKVVLNDLRVVDPRSPANDLLEADRCELEIAPRPLLQKQVVASRGRLSGLRLNLFAGKTVGDCPDFAQAAGAKWDCPPSREAADSAPAVRWFSDDSDTLAGRWITQLAERLKNSRPDQLASVERTEAFCANWSRESAALEARGIELNQRVATLQVALKAAEANPLRGGKVLTDLPQTVADLSRDIAGLNADLAKLPDQLEHERRAIVAARRADEELSRKRTTLEPIEANALSAYLLRRQAVKPLNELVGWLRWIRNPSPAAAADKPRGEDILFAGCRPTPNLLIQALELRGSARLAGQPVDLRGMLTGLSTAPALATEPVRLRLTGTGSMPLELQVTIDRTHGVKRDAILLDCQGVLWPQLALGRAEQLAITTGPSLGSLSMSVTVDGESLAGEIQMVQQNVRITPAVAGELADVPIAASLGETLGRIDSLATRASLGGTLSEPTCTLWSNLGPAVAEAVDRALEKASGEHNRATLVKAGQQVDERLTTVEQQMSELQARWSASHAAVQAKLKSIATTDLSRNGLSPDRLGRRLPTNSLLR